MEYEFHELCDLFPGMSEADYSRLRDDIRNNGLIHSITLYQGKILDGKHRYKVCNELGIEPKFTNYSGNDPIAFVKTENLSHRHLSISQIAMVASRLKEYYSDLAKERKSIIASKPKKKSDNCLINIENNEVENSPPLDKGKARDQAAAQFGVSGRSVDDAEFIQKNGIPEVVKAVEKGEMSLNEAKNISKAPAKIQSEVVSLSDKRARKSRMDKFKSKHETSKKVRNKTAPKYAEAAGTEHVRYLIGRLDLIAMDMAEKNMDASEYAEKFIKEFDRDSKELLARAIAIESAVEAITSIHIFIRGCVNSTNNRNTG